jgi:hypothetical protein
MKPPYCLHPKHYESIRAAPMDKRYRYFVARLAESGRAWTLGSDEGWVQYADDDGTHYLALWPHPAFAEDCREGWLDVRVEPVSYRYLTSKVLPHLARAGERVAVFPTPSHSGALVLPHDLAEDLRVERERMY